MIAIISQEKYREETFFFATQCKLTCEKDIQITFAYNGAFIFVALKCYYCNNYCDRDGQKEEVTTFLNIIKL